MYIPYWLELTQRPTNSPEFHYGCYTMIASNMRYFSSALCVLCSGSYKAWQRWSTEEEQCTSTRQMYQVTGCSSLKSLSWLLWWDWKHRGSSRGRIVVWKSQTSGSLVPVLELGVSNPLVDPIICEANFNLYCQSLTELIPFLFSQNNVNYAQYTPVFYKDNMIQLKQPQMAQAFWTEMLLCINRVDSSHQ